MWYVDIMKIYFQVKKKKTKNYYMQHSESQKYNAT